MVSLLELALVLVLVLVLVLAFVFVLTFVIAFGRSFALVFVSTFGFVGLEPFALQLLQLAFENLPLLQSLKVFPSAR